MSKIINELEESLKENPWVDELPEAWMTIKSGDWTDEGKFGSREDIVQHALSGRYFAVYTTRTGDHWQGHETEFESAVEVEPYTKTVTAYRKVKEVSDE
ncbi:gp5.8 [Erwinia phage vB_EamP-L1]|uniref:Gp5.8 n=1 Tax=Erwinia phage vB_EamP-L1 TaxID=1051673 RepID=G0YQ66_9CAUD|nr:gp5.8 [Erwinia phage vB_EamP-L1]AEJ81493.1 gp5.8 [Erwinia phage vB_EamP-L1]